MQPNSKSFLTHSTPRTYFLTSLTPLLLVHRRDRSQCFLGGIWMDALLLLTLWISFCLSTFFLFFWHHWLLSSLLPHKRFPGTYFPCSWHSSHQRCWEDQGIWLCFGCFWFLFQSLISLTWNKHPNVWDLTLLVLWFFDKEWKICRHPKFQAKTFLMEVSVHAILTWYHYVFWFDDREVRINRYEIQFKVEYLRHSQRNCCIEHWEKLIRFFCISWPHQLLQLSGTR